MIQKVTSKFIGFIRCFTRKRDLITRSRLMGDVAWSMGAQLLYRGSLIISAMAVARAFTPQEFAEYSFFVLTVSMFAIYGAMGLGAAASKFAAEQNSKPTESRAARVRWVLASTLALSTLVSLVVFLIPKKWLSGGEMIPLPALSLSVFLLAINATLAGLVRGLGEFRSAAVVAAVSAVVIVCFTVSAVRVNDLFWAVTGYVASALVQTIGTLKVVLRRTHSWLFPFHLRREWQGLVAMINVSLPMAINGALAGTGTWMLGRILLSSNHGEYKFGLYSIGLHWLSLGLFIPLSIASALLPRLIGSVSNGQRPNGSELLRASVFIVAGVSFAVMMLGIAVSPFAIRTYGDNFSSHIWLIPSYLLVSVIASPVATLGNALLAVDGHWVRVCFMAAWLAVVTSAGWIMRHVSFDPGAVVLGIAYFVLLCLLSTTAKRKHLL